jgi:hypothetical protein
MDGQYQRKKRILLKTTSFGFSREREKKRVLLEINIVWLGSRSLVSLNLNI